MDDTGQAIAATVIFVTLLIITGCAYVAVGYLNEIAISLRRLEHKGTGSP